MKGNKIFFILAILAALAALPGCTAGTQTGDESAEEEEGIVSYSVSDYKDRIREDRTALSDYKDQYASDINMVTGNEYKKLHFETAVFKKFPDTDRFMLMTEGQEEISVEDTLKITEDWLEKTGKADVVDLESELIFNNLNHPYLELDAEKPLVDIGHETYMPLFFDYISELRYGTGAMLYRDDCYMIITQNGISYMNDGKLTDYLREKGTAVNAQDISSVDNLGTKVISGRTEELAGESYQLMDGMLSVGEGADIAEKFFAEDTGRISREGIHMEAEEVSVYQIDDISYYKYFMQKYCYGIPITLVETGNYSFYGNYHVAGEKGEAYVASKDGVTAYQQINDGEELIPLLEENSLIGVADAAEILSESLASQINVSVNTVGLTYVAFKFEGADNSFETIYFPCWNFSGTNRVKDENIPLFVDVLTGDVYYYTFTQAKQQFDLEEK